MTTPRVVTAAVATPASPAASPAGYSWQRNLPATASIVRRFVALGIDLVIVFALAWVCTFMAAAAGFLRIPDVVFQGEVRPILGLLSAVSLFEIPIFLVYATLFHAHGGRTPGKLLTGIRVERIDGQPLRLMDCFLRSLLYLLWVTPVGIAFIVIDAWTMHATELDQRLGDLAAGTVVVSERPA